MWNKITSFFTSSKKQQNNNNSQNDDFQPQQQQNQQQYYESFSGAESVRLLKEVDKQKKVVAVIVSFCSGSSYDHLFTSVQQKAEEGTQVLVYACNSGAVKEISEGFKTQSKNDIIKGMVAYIKSLDPDCVVFNWECSSGYSNQSFGEGSGNVFSFAKMMIDRGHMVMFSDFSLKALIAQWDKKLMGPNPFVKVNQFGGNFTLEFDANQLKECPSAQLQIIGQMAAVGHCNVHALGGTIVFGVDHKNADTDVYKLQVLTIVTSIGGNQKYHSQIKDKKGLAGHVLLTYKSGGHLLVSMGHWVELMKVDTSDKVLFQVAAREYGEVKAQQMQMEYANLSNQSEKKQYISRNAVEFVQSSAPCANMSKKARMQKF